MLEQLYRIIEVGAGLFATAFVNDNILSPAVQNLAGGVLTAEPEQKAADAATTFASAWGVGALLRLLGQDRLAGAMEMGGFGYASAKAVTVPFTGLSLSAVVPNPLHIGFAKALPAGTTPAQIGQPGSVVALNPGTNNVTQVPPLGSGGSLQTYGSTGDQYVFSYQGSATAGPLAGGY